MEFVDISGDERIPVFMKMVRELGQAKEPEEALNAFLKALARAHNWFSYIHVACMDCRDGEYRIVRFVDQQGQEVVERHDMGDIATLPSLKSGGFLSEIVATPEPKLLRTMNVQDDPVLGAALASFQSAVAVPMFYRDDGVQWIVLFDENPDGFAPKDVEEILVRSNMIGSNADRLGVQRQLMQATEHIQREVDEIAAIQHSLLPGSMPNIPGLKVAANYETFDRAGGDYYDFCPLRRTEDGAEDPFGPWGIIIADASGHGPAAAVVMAMVHTLFHSYPHEPSGPRELIEHMNANLQSNRIRHAFVTAFFAIYYPKTRELRYVRAGHDAPILMQPGEAHKMKRLDAVGGFPLGVSEKVGSKEAMIVLETGQSLVLYTDGITEALSPDGEMFRVEGIEKALISCNGQPDCVILEVVDALKTHEAGGRAKDDQTLVALHVEDLPEN